MADDDHIHKPIIEFIGGRFPELELEPGDDIFARGFVNSLFAMELVMFIENTFAFAVPNEALRLDNFRTVNAMAELIRRHTELVEESRPL